jgi:copper chaperone
MEKSYIIDGMSCQGCANGISKAIAQEIPNATVSVDLDHKTVTVSPADDDAIKRATDAAGFDFIGIKG